MSSNSFAAFRPSNTSFDLRKLADQHLQHDLEPSDRSALKSAASALSTYATIGSLVGLGLGFTLAWRVRQNRVKMFEAFKAARRPTHVRFADGKEEPIPDLTPFLRPTTLGDAATYTFFGIAGLFLGGELGLLTGAGSARHKITGDPQRKRRIEKALLAFRVDVLREQLRVAEGELGTGAETGKDGEGWKWDF